MTDIADSVFCAGMACAADLPAVKYTRRLPGEEKSEEAERRPELWETAVYSFPQSWESTALGFGGIGGSSITTAQTTVVIHNCSAAIYFSTRLAYVVRDFTHVLMEDIGKCNMARCGKQGKYRPT